MNRRNKTKNYFESENASPKGQPLQKNISLAEDWHDAYKNSLKTVSALYKETQLKEEKALLTNVISVYHMSIPRYYLSLIDDINNPNDPIRKQCVPSIDELDVEQNEVMDPLSEEKNSPTPWLVHRYPDRVLLLATSRCFMYCRHCTRKRLWSHNIFDASLKDIDIALDYVKNNPKIREVIISGGDPLTLETERLDYILSGVSSLPNIEAIRIGTRAPVVLPQRIDDRLCVMLERYPTLWINLQFNHPREITSQSIQACRKLQKCGIPLSNQSVLLRGVNDTPEVMIKLCQKLQSIRVRPYYLFECDPVVGASHFRTSVLKGVEIIERMRGHIGGMCVPVFVVDGIDGKGKIPLGSNYVISSSPRGFTLRNYKNEIFFYSNPSEKK